MGRVNSAAVYASGGGSATAEELASVARSYESRGAPVRFRLTPLTPRNALPLLLAAGGQVSRPVVVMTLDLAAVGAAGSPPTVELTPGAGAEWAETYLSAYDAREGRPRLELAVAAPSPRRYALARSERGVAGIALGVLVDGALGVFDVLTVPEHRRTGVATATVGALLEWGRDEGADIAYLQVAADNAGALRLYERLGFEPAYEYLYAWPAPPSSPV